MDILHAILVFGGIALFFLGLVVVESVDVGWRLMLSGAACIVVVGDSDLGQEEPLKSKLRHYRYAGDVGARGNLSHVDQ